MNKSLDVRSVHLIGEALHLRIARAIAIAEKVIPRRGCILARRLVRGEVEENVNGMLRHRTGQALADAVPEDIWFRNVEVDRPVECHRCEDLHAANAVSERKSLLWQEPRATITSPLEKLHLMHEGYAARSQGLGVVKP